MSGTVNLIGVLRFQKNFIYVLKKKLVSWTKVNKEFLLYMDKNV